MHALENLSFPLHFTFRITTLTSDFVLTDSNDSEAAYVRQKLFKLKEEVIVFSDRSKSKALFHINADRWLDFNASYHITDAETGASLGRITRKGVHSLWKATYTVFNAQNEKIFTIKEDNGWIKVLDSIVGEIPIVGLFTGYILNPSYSAENSSGEKIYTLTKKPSFFGRKFSLTRKTDRPDSEETLIALSFMMMILLERSRG